MSSKMKCWLLAGLFLSTFVVIPNSQADLLKGEYCSGLDDVSCHVEYRDAYDMNPFSGAVKVSLTHPDTYGQTLKSGNALKQGLFYVGDHLDLKLEVHEQLVQFQLCSLKMDTVLTNTSTNEVISKHFEDAAMNWTWGSFQTGDYVASPASLVFTTAGAYTASYTINMNCAMSNKPNFEGTFNGSYNIGNIYVIKFADPIKISTLKCLDKFKFSTMKDSTVKCNLYVTDKSNLLLNVRVAGIGFPGNDSQDIAKNKSWTKTKDTWQIPFKQKIFMLTPAEMDNKHQVETGNFFVSLGLAGVPTNPIDTKKVQLYTHINCECFGNGFTNKTLAFTITK